MEFTGKTVALLGDIHGNSWALAAVLADIARRGIKQIVNLGDSLYGSLDPSGTAQQLIDAGIPSICGNQDWIVYAPTPAVGASSDYAFVTQALTQEQIAWLQGQPKTLRIRPIFCCHGTPTQDDEYLLEEVYAGGVRLRSDNALKDIVAEIDAPIIACGHSHVPRTVWLSTGQLIVNPGSVGIPAYEHDAPYPHVMEAGSPHARYAILTDSAQGWSVEQIALAYDWQQAATTAEKNGRPDRARWITSGRANVGDSIVMPKSKMTKPDFSGVWKFNASESSLQIPLPDKTLFSIRHQEPHFHLERTLVVNGVSDTFSIDLTTDGTAVTRTRRGFDIVARLSWQGDVLYFDTHLNRDGKQATNRVRYRLEENGKRFVADETFQSEESSYENRWVLDKE